MIVRKASSMQDVEKMVALGAEMHAESRYAAKPYLFSKLEGYGSHYVRDPNAGVCILAEEDDACHGIMVGFASKTYFSDELCAKEMVLYVRPAKRKGTTAMRLVREFEHWAKEIGAAEIHVGVTADIDDDKAIRFYNAMGYGPRGIILAKEI